MKKTIIIKSINDFNPVILIISTPACLALSHISDCITMSTRRLQDIHIIAVMSGPAVACGAKKFY
jgi:hypothetical protein